MYCGDESQQYTYRYHKIIEIHGQMATMHVQLSFNYHGYFRFC